MYQNPIHISYTPTYLLTGDTKITYLNTVSLHKYFDDVHTNHNIVSSDVIILSETRLTNYDTNQDYKLPSFKGPFRNDQHWNGHTCPPHSMAFYVNEQMNLLENKKWTRELFEAILTVY